jgi:hypothetical protein
MSNFAIKTFIFFTLPIIGAVAMIVLPIVILFAMVALPWAKVTRENGKIEVGF